MTDHAACILAIVGSRDVHKVSALALIESVLAAHKPLMVISGGAKANWTNRKAGLVSIDEEAARIAREQGIPMTEFLPTNFHWGGIGGFQERNKKIADSCVCLVRIASDTSTTYGSGWTADWAEANGKDVTRYVITTTGEVKNG